MEKQIITVARKTVAFKCKFCSRMVDVNLAKPKTTETEEAIIHSWDYGHEHKIQYSIERVNGKDVLTPFHDED